MFTELMIIFSVMMSALSAHEYGQEVIRLKGSDTMGAKLVPQLCEVYKIDHPGIKFEIVAEGSSTAFRALLDGTTDIGMSSRELKPEEAKLFEDRKILLRKHFAAYDCFVIFVHGNNPVNNLTAKQIEGLFTGDIANWKDVGGMDAEVTLCTRNSASGSHEDFSRIAMN